MRSRFTRHIRHLTLPLVIVGTVGALVGTTGALAGMTGLPLGATAACGCEVKEEEIEKGTTVAWEAKKNNVVVNECNFRVENKPCEIIMKVKGNGEGVIVEKHEENGMKWKNRYALTEGCVVGATYKPVSNCTDSIAVNVAEVNTENEYCTALEKEDKEAPKPVVAFCFKLKE